MPNFEEDMGTNTILGNREHKKKNEFWGTGEQANLFQGNRYPPPWEGFFIGPNPGDQIWVFIKRLVVVFNKIGHPLSYCIVVNIHICWCHLAQSKITSYTFERTFGLNRWIHSS